MPRTRIAPGTTLPLELTDRERELILKHSFAPDELTRQLRIVPQPGKPAVARYTLDDLDDLAGYVAAESNHAKNRSMGSRPCGWQTPPRCRACSREPSSNTEP